MDTDTAGAIAEESEWDWEVASNAQDSVLSWAVASDDRWEKKRFLKRFLNCLNAEELKDASRITMRVKRQRKSYEVATQIKRPGNTLAVPTEIGKLPDLAVSPAEVETLHTSSAWWSYWEQHGFRDVFAVDIEKVSVAQEQTNTRKQVAATVSISNFWGDIVKEWVIRHDPGTFLVNRFTRVVNGFESFSLMKGSPIAVVKKELETFMDSKLWIMVDAAGDFSSLDFKPNEHDYFDLQSEYYSYLTDEHGAQSWSGHSLRSIYEHFFHTPFQTGPHTSAEDAKATIKIFREVYLKTKTTAVHTKHNPFPADNIIRLKSAVQVLKDKIKHRKW